MPFGTCKSVWFGLPAKCGPCLSGRLRGLLTVVYLLHLRLWGSSSGSGNLVARPDTDKPEACWHLSARECSASH